MQSIYKFLSVMILASGCVAASDVADQDEVTSSITSFAHIIPSGGSPDQCALVSNANSGLYCGNSTQSGFLGSASAASELFTCVGSKTVDIAPCQTSCTIEGVGQPDKCNPDPCANVPDNNFIFCGKSTQDHFNSTDASFFALYTCSSHKTVGFKFCPNGCTVAPPGVADFCN